MSQKNKLEMELDRLKSLLPSAEKDLEKANPLLAVLLTVISVGIGFAFPICWLGSIAGGIMFLTAISRQNAAKKELEHINEKITKVRKQIADLDD